MLKTIEDLKAAFAGESQANRKYTAFAKKADDEGYAQIATLFRAVAAAEAVHTFNHLKAMDGLHDTSENLRVAIEGENYEVNTMYPDFIQDAEAEGHTRALRSFRWALEVEKIHEVLYKKALENIDEGKEAKLDYYICPICGFTHEGPFDGKCPICGYPGEKFEQIS